MYWELFCFVLFWESGSQFFEKPTSINLFANGYLRLRLLVPRKQNVLCYSPPWAWVLVRVVTVRVKVRVRVRVRVKVRVRVSQDQILLIAECVWMKYR